MKSMFSEAIVRLPGSNFAQGLTSVQLGAPHQEMMLAQHARYCEALQACGLRLTVLGPDAEYPDSTFVEDTAVVCARGAVLTRPGAPSRAGEVAAMRPILERFFPALGEIVAPGTLDGGDICQAGDHFFLGISLRTNQPGAAQLAAHLARHGYSSETVDVRGIQNLLHLKSGVSYIGRNTLVVIEEVAGLEQFAAYEQIRVAPEESYAANCVRVNERVLVAAGYPRLLGELTARGFDPLQLAMSEFQKMDGGLSCLSLRF